MVLSGLFADDGLSQSIARGLSQIKTNTDTDRQINEQSACSFSGRCNPPFLFAWCESSSQLTIAPQSGNLAFKAKEH